MWWVQNYSWNSRTLKKGLRGCPETSVMNYHCPLRTIPEGRRSHVQPNVSVRMAWISFGALPCRGGKKTWQLPSRCCWNRALLCHASELVSFLVGLRTCQHSCTSRRKTSFICYFFRGVFMRFVQFIRINNDYFCIMYYVPPIHNNISVQRYNIYSQVTLRQHVSTVNVHLQGNRE